MTKGLVLAAVLFGLPVAVSAATGIVVGDTYISPINPTINFGNATALNIGGGASALIQVDLSSLPTGLLASNIRRATLTVFVNKVFIAGGLDFSQVTTPWSEGTVTFNTQPTIRGTPFINNVAVNTSATFLTVDITDLVQQWVTGVSPNFGVEITAAVAAPGTVVNLDSKESTSTSHSAFADITIQF